MKLILASKSPRRRDILTEYGYEFSVHSSDFEEKDLAFSPIQTAISNAIGKATAVYDEIKDGQAVVLGADTVVFFNDRLLGKPKNPLAAIEMLKALSNNTHKVVTGYAIVSRNGTVSGFSESEVTFNQLSDSQIEQYVDSGKPLDKAGAYGIQDGYGLVKSFSGSLNNVIGLPIEDVKPILDKALKE